MINHADRINAELTDEARATLRTTVIDLDAFLALSGEQRAARWRQMDRVGKWQLVALAFERKHIDWMPSEVEQAIVLWDGKYAASSVEAAVEGALERLALEHGQAARLAERLNDKAHRKAERAATTAFTNALIEYRAGIRPQLLASGAWLLPSRRGGEPPHIVRMDGDWVCSCKAGASMHWPIALVIGLDVAQDDMQRFDDPSDDQPPAVVAFERRLTETAHILDEMRAAQQHGQRLAEARRVYLEAA